MVADRWAPLVVVSGPSGVGKTTVVARLLAGSRLPLRRAITATTRAPRPGEVDGIDYRFWSFDQFRAAIDAGAMLEHAIVHGKNYYGTPRDEVEPFLAAGTGVILVIDVQGAEQVRQAHRGHCLTVFLEPPTFADLERRLSGPERSESDEAIRTRLTTARLELDRAEEFDRRIVNSNLDETVQELESLVAALFPKPEESGTCSMN